MAIEVNEREATEWLNGKMETLIEIARNGDLSIEKTEKGENDSREIHDCNFLKR